MNRLYETASVNCTQETAESIILMTGQSERVCKTECTIVGAAGVKQLRLITLNNSRKYIYFGKSFFAIRTVHVLEKVLL